jgi:CheY-like chemotaxis protein
MPNTKAKVLVVDDEPLIRTTMSMVLAGIGYQVRSAEDGFSALREIRQEMPDILLSDLNMPGMSGFELLSVVGRRFPAVHKIAMSGAYLGTEVPAGASADAFYQKGSGMDSLLHILGTLPQIKRRAPQPSNSAQPLWIHRNGNGSAPETCVTISCPECLRSFPQAIDDSDGLVRETDCIHCSNPIQYTIVQPPTACLRRQYSAAHKQPSSRPQQPKTTVIPIAATDSIIVRCAVEGPPPGAPGASHLGTWESRPNLCRSLFLFLNPPRAVILAQPESPSLPLPVLHQQPATNNQQPFPCQDPRTPKFPLTNTNQTT